jgi:hypothetical protein
MTAPVLGSGSWPAWMQSVPKPLKVGNEIIIAYQETKERRKCQHIKKKQQTPDDSTSDNATDDRSICHKQSAHNEKWTQLKKKFRRMDTRQGDTATRLNCVSFHTLDNFSETMIDIVIDQQLSMIYCNVTLTVSIQSSCWWVLTMMEKWSLLLVLQSIFQQQCEKQFIDNEHISKLTSGFKQWINQWISTEKEMSNLFAKK